jgi:hypothetical protein
MQNRLAGRYGFNGLNSIQFNELTRMIKAQEEAFYQSTDNEKYKKTFKEWIKYNDDREYEMIKNIYNYSKENKYIKAIFLIGADHLESITKKIQEYQEERVRINWIINTVDLTR